mmetsp:Transcript_26357/g.59485  ORF Transcript_26357/g.59485 Transcript_26357/m.59485 type:complete len:240 (+) Transcript_26357:3-722(+)
MSARTRSPPEQPQALLFVGASTGDAASVKRALRCRADPNLTATKCECLLPESHCVCLGYAPLHCAAQAGAGRCLGILLHARANLSVRCGRMRFNIQADGGVSSTIVNGLTPLHVAVACGHVSVVKMLLQRGAETRQEATEPRKTAVGIAAWAKQPDLLELLREAAYEEVRRLADSAPETPGLGRGHSSLEQGAGPSTCPGLLQHPRLRALQRRIREKQQREEDSSSPGPRRLHRRRLAG